ncbi:uncharacterized oxidoreductase Lmo0432-like [Amphiura filiformis]|uniref:uncharacterized oxidoreductase Lmo0432-like n=1 Tax=Amphiura filiformis TaxID=82378 RepID=UPI003B216EFE
MLVHPKDKRDPLNSTEVVYSIPCKNCNETFVGETGRKFDKPLAGKVAVVTGSSSGIGKVIALRLAEAGASVVLCARREDKLQEVKEMIEKNGGKALIVKTDVTVRQQVKDLIQKAETFGPVDIMVNNAGIFAYTLMKNVKEDDWERCIDVNCKGVCNGIGAVLPGMVARGKGHIVNISSDSGRIPFAGCAVYTGSKFFVEGMSKCLRLELEGTEVRVTNIQPGNTADTEIFNNVTDQEAATMLDKKYPHFKNVKMLKPDDIARAVLYAVTQPPTVAVQEIMVQPTDLQIQ